jgi:hypothetical protein
MAALCAVIVFGLVVLGAMAVVSRLFH